MNGSDCLFCKMVDGEIPASIVYEDDLCMAFMDIYPLTRGHCLLIPKEHYKNMLDVDPAVAAHLAKKLALLTNKTNHALHPDGVMNVIANGAGAGQEISHLHIHIIPRNHGDDFGFRFPDGYRDEPADRDELDELAERISKA